MSYLKQKSDQNIIAAEFLINEGLHAPSVHCSYYGSFQLIKHTLSAFFGISYKKQESELNVLKQSRGSVRIGSHEYVINRFGEELRDLSKKEYSSFSRNIKELKAFRNKSDYLNIEVTSKQSERAYRLSEEIVGMLKTNCHV
jgi:hypothetical protein